MMSASAAIRCVDVNCHHQPNSDKQFSEVLQ